MSERLNTEGDERAAAAPKRSKAGLFDIRSIIAMLIAIYGLILVITSFFTSDSQVQRTNGANLNLWAGIGMLVVAAVFAVWVKLRPTVVVEDPEHLHGEDGRPPGH